MDANTGHGQFPFRDDHMESRQCTVRSPMAASGPSRCGRPSRLRLMPAPAGTGIEFIRTDLPDTPRLRARLDLLEAHGEEFTLRAGPVRIVGAQALLAAAAGLAIDNVRIETDGPTLPLLDGSAAPYVFLLQSAGIRRQRELRRWLRLSRTLQVRGDGTAGPQGARLSPYPGIRLTRSPGRLSFAGRGSEFLRELSRARCYGAAETLRFSDEKARRELLEAAALLALVDGVLLAELTLENADAALLLRLLRALEADPEAVDIVSAAASTGAALRGAGQAA